MNENKTNDEDRFAELLQSIRPVPADNVAATFYRAGWEAAYQSQASEISTKPKLKEGYVFFAGLISGLAACLALAMLVPMTGNVRPIESIAVTTWEDEKESEITSFAHSGILPLLMFGDLRTRMVGVSASQASLSWIGGRDADSRVSEEAIRNSQPTPSVIFETDVENDDALETMPFKTPRGLSSPEELLQLFQKV